MFKGQPKGLFALALANTGERFGYYTMLAIFLLFIQAKFGFSAAAATQIYSIFLAGVYFMPFFGGILADKIGYGKCVTIGIGVMFAGYLCLAIPTAPDLAGKIMMFGALTLIAIGTGLFKGNLQVMVGNLYDDPKYAEKRDAGFSIFYMAINIGALFAPTAAVKIKEWAEVSLGFSGNDAYHFSFAVACAALILSMSIYYIFRPTFRHVEGGERKKGEAAVEDTLTPAETKSRMTALFLVFAVVIFFWMAFHQNGLTLTYFADEFTQKTSTGLQSMAFNVWNLVLVIIGVYGTFSIFQSENNKGKFISAAVVAAVIAILVYKYLHLSGEIAVSAPIFQQFNPFYVVALTPVSMAIFSALAAKKKEPSAPRKIAYGMLVAAAGFVVMIIASLGLLTPDAQKAAGDAGTFCSANWLISTYLVLTFAELLLSPMGISFVSKVAPPKYKGMMMGCWFVATALGNMLVSVGGFLWGNIPLWVVWSVFTGLCLLSALFMFVMMKKLESATK